MKKNYIVAKDISRWKLDNKFENFLSYKADKSEFWKRIYVWYYKIFDHKYYKTGLEFIKKEIDRQRPNIDSHYPLSDSFLIRDMIYSLHRYGASFNDYFFFKFYDLNYRGKEKFNTLKQQYGFCSVANAPSVRNLCDDKIETYNRFKQYFKRDVIAVTTDKDLNKANDFINKHSKLILKPIRGHSGEGIKILASDEINDDLIFNYVRKGGLIMEELIIQDSRMAALNSSCINTVRLATFNDGKQLNIFGAALRMGRAGAIVDNAGAGGIFATLDPEYGMIIKRATDLQSNYYVVHPDSAVTIPGFKIPEWNEAIKMLKQMAEEIPEGKLLAWDLALSEKGWCLVEINDIGDQHMFQYADIVGKKALLFDYIKTLK